MSNPTNPPQEITVCGYCGQRIPEPQYFTGGTAEVTVCEPDPPEPAPGFAEEAAARIVRDAQASFGTVGDIAEPLIAVGVRAGLRRAAAEAMAERQSWTGPAAAACVRIAKRIDALTEAK